MDDVQKFKKHPQIISTIIITIGGFNLGTAIGWSSPAQSLVIEKLNITNSQFSWVVSSMPLGAAFSQLFAAFLMDIIGRKLTLIFQSTLVLLAWILLTILPYYGTFILSRSLLGLFVGGYCVVCPSYIGEFAHKSLRGLLTCIFQFQVVTGILFVFLFAYVENMLIMNLCCAFFPILLILLLIVYVPESPAYYLLKNKDEKAQQSMQFYRGKKYDVTNEINQLKIVSGSAPLFKSLKERACYKATIILLGVHITQQLCGINAVLYYVQSIFKSSKTNISDKLSAIIIGIVEIVMTGVATLTIDKIGRKRLWCISLCIIFICLVLVGLYFSISKHNPNLAANFGVLPTLAIGGYICGFSLGAGPLPWVMIGELLPGKIKAKAGTFVAFLNWLLAFVITLTFPLLTDILGMDIVCYLFAGFAILGFLFVLFCVIETKQLSLDEIQQKLTISNKKEEK